MKRSQHERGKAVDDVRIKVRTYPMPDGNDVKVARVITPEGEVLLSTRKAIGMIGGIGFVGSSAEWDGDEDPAVIRTLAEKVMSEGSRSRPFKSGDAKDKREGKL